MWAEATKASILVVPRVSEDTQNGFSILSRWFGQLDGNKTCPRLHGDQCLVKNQKRLIDSVRALNRVMKHQEATAVADQQTKTATGFRLSAAVVTRPRCVQFWGEKSLGRIESIFHPDKIMEPLSANTQGQSTWGFSGEMADTRVTWCFRPFSNESVWEFTQIKQEEPSFFTRVFTSGSEKEEGDFVRALPHTQPPQAATVQKTTKFSFLSFRLSLHTNTKKV